MSEVAIFTEGLSKTFEAQAAVSELNLRIQPAAVYGFLGRNGAGKTTTMRMLLGLVRPTKGNARVLGLDPRKEGTLTRYWEMPLLLIAPWTMVIVGLPVLGLTILMTALRGSAKGGLIYTAGIVSVYLIVRQLVTVSMHVNLPTLFAGPVIWLMNNKPFVPLSAFPWGSLWRAVFLAAALPLAAQYLLKRTEV